MKKIISILLAALVPVLMFTACADKTAADTAPTATVKNDEFTPGVYYITGEETHSVQIQIRDSHKIAIQYNHKTVTESGKYTIEGNVLRAAIEKTDCEYVFNITDGKLVYDAANSKASEKFLSDSGIVDGTEFYLGHGFEER